MASSATNLPDKLTADKSTRIHKLGLPMRMLATLEGDGIRTLGDLCHCTRAYLIQLPHIGRNRIAIIDRLMARLGCALLDAPSSQDKSQEYRERKPAECPLNGRGF